MALEVSRTLENIVGEGNVILTNKPFMGSEDFGCFTQHVPGVLFWLGIARVRTISPCTIRISKWICRPCLLARPAMSRTRCIS